MAIYHFSVSVVSRASGRSSVASAAYRAREKIKNERDGLTHDYTKLKDLVYEKIMLPKNAPKEFENRSKLWNEVERTEKRKDSQTAREIKTALPKELKREEQIKLIREYVKKNFVDKGMCADICVHDKNDGNPHAHILLTTRDLDENGFKNKNRDWNSKELLIQWRENWSKTVNKYLEKNKIDERIDHRSYEEQGVIKFPQKHLGHKANSLEQKGIKTEKGNYNREIRKTNEQLKDLDNKIYKLEELKQTYIGLREQEEKTKIQDPNYQRACELKENYMKIEQSKEKLSKLDEICEKNKIVNEKLIEPLDKEIASQTKKLRELERNVSSEKFKRGNLKFYQTKEKRAADERVQKYQEKIKVVKSDIQKLENEKINRINKIRERVPSSIENFTDTARYQERYRLNEIQKSLVREYQKIRPQLEESDRKNFDNSFKNTLEKLVKEQERERERKINRSKSRDRGYSR